MAKSSSPKFGVIYFYHPQEPKNQYVGPAIAKELGATSMQIDTAYVSLWYILEKKPGVYDWSFVDKAYDDCEREGIEPIASLCHHFIPPKWIENGPFNDKLVTTPQYGSKYGPEYEKLTEAQKSFADFVTEFVTRYRSRTKLYTMSHEWNISWLCSSKKDTPEYERLVKNQVMCTLLAYNIVKKMAPNAQFTYGLHNFYRRDKMDGKPTTPLFYSADEMVFGPSFMIKKFVETGNKDFLNLMSTSQVFHFGYTDAAGLDWAPIYVDGRAGDDAETLYNGQVVVDGKTYRYKDYIKEIIVNPFTATGKWGLNTKKSYSEEEQVELFKESISNILSAKSRGVPITRVLVGLNDKNEYNGGLDPWIIVPEGIYKMRGQIDQLKNGPTTWTVTYEPKKAASAYKQIIRSVQ